MAAPRVPRRGFRSGEPRRRERGEQSFQTRASGERDSQVVGVLGTQWGDEGKGKLVDALADGRNIVARAQGGGNAGHTVRSHHGTPDIMTCVLAFALSPLEPNHVHWLRTDRRPRW